MQTPLPTDTGQIPVIDMSMSGQGAGGQRALAAAVDRALTEIGFFVLIGHGLDWVRVEETAAICREFFDQPQTVKEAVANQGVPFRGYLGYGGENLSFTEDEVSPPDWKENFLMGRPDLSDPYFRDPMHHGTFKSNVWPKQMPQLREALEWYYRAMEGLTDSLMQVLATALSLDPLFFRDKLDRHDSTLRAANYPHQPRSPLPGQLRAGAHTDYGVVTILKIEEAPGGLQVRTRSGAWVDAPVVNQGLVINIGDLMMTWTNDRWLSNMHRVVNPPRDSAGSARRQSMVYFVNCNPDARIECLPTCQSADNPPRHAPIGAGEHRRMKVVKSAQAETSAKTLM